MKLTLSTFVLSLFIVLGATAQDNEAMIEQLDNSHDAIIGQIGSYNSATADQKGGNNSFALNQTGSHKAILEQTGAENIATIDQWVGSQNNAPGASSVLIDQAGKGNSVNLPQTQSNSTVSSIGEEYGSSAFALLMQHGFSNDIVLAQNGSHYASFTQNGSQNNATV